MGHDIECRTAFQRPTDHGTMSFRWRKRSWRPLPTGRSGARTGRMCSTANGCPTMRSFSNFCFASLRVPNFAARSWWIIRLAFISFDPLKHSRLSRTRRLSSADMSVYGGRSLAVWLVRSLVLLRARTHKSGPPGSTTLRSALRLNSGARADIAGGPSWAKEAT